MHVYTHRLEVYCPAAFHHYLGVDVCLVCAKKRCRVFSMHAYGRFHAKMKSRAIRPKLNWENPHLVAHNCDALKAANPEMSEWMINEFLKGVL